MSIYPNSSSALEVLKNKLGQPEGMVLASLYRLSLSLMATGFESCLMFSLRLVKTECCLGLGGLERGYVTHWGYWRGRG